jgi:uncharacterized membrane protein
LIAVNERSISHSSLLAPDSQPVPSTHAIHWIILICLLGTGATFRFYRIDRQALWLDEYWAVYLATGRGQAGSSIFDAPLGVLFDPPPQMGFADAPPWLRIWTGLDFTTHPPFYYMVLRWWVDLFGDSDAALRSLSAVADLTAAIVLFDCVRRMGGPWAGLLASALMLFSVAQLDQSREVRSYALVALLALLFARTIIEIERRGATWGWLTLLALESAAIALTHYLAVGIIAGLAAYVFLRLEGRARIKMLGAILGAVLLAAIAWGPFIWTRSWRTSTPDYPAPATYAQIAMYSLLAPTRLILSLTHVSWLGIFPLLVLTLVPCVIYFRRPGDRLLWSLWLICGAGLFLGFDVLRHTRSISITKYLVPVAPAVYALVALHLLHRSRTDRLSIAAQIFLIAGAAATVWEALGGSHVGGAGWFPILCCGLAVFALLSIAGLRTKSWRMWVAGAIGLVCTMNESMLAARSHVYVIYFAMAGTWIFLMATTPAHGRCAWLGPLAGLALAVWGFTAAAQFTASGSQIIVKGDWPGAAGALLKSAAPNDVLAFTACGDPSPAFCYIAFTHYAPELKQPVILLGPDGLNPSTRTELSIRCSPRSGRCVWMIGNNPDGDTQRFFPGWRRGPAKEFGQLCDLWPIYPPA